MIALLAMGTLVGAAYLLYKRAPAHSKCPAAYERWRRKKREKARRLLRDPSLLRDEPQRREARQTLRFCRKTQPTRWARGWLAETREVKTVESVASTSSQQLTREDTVPSTTSSTKEQGT